MGNATGGGDDVQLPDSFDWRQAALDFADLGRALRRFGGPQNVLAALPALAVQRLTPAAAASITTYSEGRFRTEGATDQRVRLADELQYRLSEGPCVDALTEEHLYNPADLAHDPRWPTFGTQVVNEIGFVSMLSIRLMIDSSVASLNLYSGQAQAFDEAAVNTGILLATHAGEAVNAAYYQDQAANLEQALQTSRDIGVAVGVLMGVQRINRDQALDALRVASQHLNRRVADLATAVAETGILPELPGGRSRARR